MEGIIAGFVFVGLCAIVAILIIVNAIYSKEGEVLLFLLFPIITGIVVGICSGEELAAYNSSYENVTYLVSITRENFAEGHFCLGTGTVDEKMYYIAYTPVSENQYTITKFLAEGLIITETNDVKPQYKEEKLPQSFTVTKDLFVPVGTVYQEFKL